MRAVPGILTLVLTAHAWPLPTGPGPYHLAAGDLNHDGFPDLVVVCRGELRSPTEKRPANDTITVYFTQGSPEPVQRKDFQVGFGPYTAVVGDLDGDGNLDVAVANFQANDGRHLSILWGQRAAPFLEPARHVSIPGGHAYDKQRTATGAPVYPTPGLTSVAVLAGVRHALPDLVAVAWSSDFFVVLRNDGRRGFTPARYPLMPGPRDVAVADFNRDGIPDLAFSIYSSNLVEIWQGRRRGGFRKVQVFHAQGHIPYHLKAGDLDGDGWLDLAVGNRGPSDNVAVFHNRHGRFAYTGSYQPGTVASGETTSDEIRDVLLADFNGDGRLDLVAACHVSHKVVAWEGTGEQTFNRAFTKPASFAFPGQGPRALVMLGNRIAVALFAADEWQWLPSQ